MLLFNYAKSPFQLSSTIRRTDTGVFNNRSLRPPFVYRTNHLKPIYGWMDRQVRVRVREGKMFYKALYYQQLMGELRSNDL